MKKESFSSEFLHEAESSVNNNLDQYKVAIDIRDIVDTQKLRGLNQNVELQKTVEQRKCYIYDYYIQINLCVFDGGNYLQNESQDY